MEVHPVTQEPLQKHKASRQLEEVERLQKLMGEGAAYDEELKSDEGTLLKKYIQKALMTKIDLLAHNDAECAAYIKLLAEIGHKIAVGRKASEDMIRRELREG